MSHGQALQVECAENIGLLSLLHLVPTLPKTNPLHSIPDSNKYTYTLPFATERGLAGTLAFISSIRDDPNHIPAVCVGEEPGSNYVKIFLAVNKTGVNDGNGMLFDVKQAFDELFRILAKGFDGE